MTEQHLTYDLTYNKRCTFGNCGIAFCVFSREGLPLDRAINCIVAYRLYQATMELSPQWMKGQECVKPQH